MICVIPNITLCHTVHHANPGTCYTPRPQFSATLESHSGCSPNVTSNCSKNYQQAGVGQYAQADNVTGMVQVLTALAAFVTLWWAALVSAGISVWFTVAVVLLISLFTLRVFALMHECGHGSLFRSQWLNRTAGFLLGVVGNAAVCVVTAP